MTKGGSSKSSGGCRNSQVPLRFSMSCRTKGESGFSFFVSQRARSLSVGAGGNDTLARSISGGAAAADANLH